MSREKKIIKNRDKLNIWAQWLLPIAILVIVLLVMVIRFGNDRQLSAKELIYKEVEDTAENYVNSMNNAISSVINTGMGAASVLRSQETFTQDSIAKYADNIEQDSASIGRVVLVNKNGIAIDDDGREFNIKDFPECSLSTSVVTSYFVANEIYEKDSVLVQIPVKRDAEFVGDIYLFCDIEYLEQQLPVKEYNDKMCYAIINSEGEIINRFGEACNLVLADNLLDSLSKAEIDVYSFNQVKVRVNRNNLSAFAAVYEGEKKVVSIAPLSSGGWALVSMFNASYIDTMILSEMNSTKKLFRGLIITIILFMMTLCTISLLNKFKFNEQNKNLANKADTDLLTEVNNKIATQRKIQEFIDENPDTQSLVFMFDVDNFKKINDTMGHAFGDEVLSTLGHQLSNEFRSTDIIGRLGGDEFMVFLKNIKSDEQLEREGVRINNFFHQFKAGNYVKYSATASIGACVYPRDGKNFQELYKAADKALYEAKRRGKNQLVFYSKELSSVESIRVTDDIEH